MNARYWESPEDAARTTEPELDAIYYVVEYAELEKENARLRADYAALALAVMGGKDIPDHASLLDLAAEGADCRMAFVSVGELENETARLRADLAKLSDSATRLCDALKGPVDAESTTTEKETT